jgi:hypothetical protein
MLGSLTAEIGEHFEFVRLPCHFASTGRHWQAGETKSIPPIQIGRGSFEQETEAGVRGGHGQWGRAGYGKRAA